MSSANCGCSASIHFSDLCFGGCKWCPVFGLNGCFGPSRGSVFVLRLFSVCCWSRVVTFHSAGYCWDIYFSITVVGCCWIDCHCSSTDRFLQIFPRSVLNILVFSQIMESKTPPLPPPTFFSSFFSPPRFLKMGLSLAVLMRLSVSTMSWPQGLVCWRSWWPEMSMLVRKMSRIVLPLTGCLLLSFILLKWKSLVFWG